MKSFFLIAFVAIFCQPIHSVDFEIVNYLPGEIWVGILGNSGQQHLAGGGFRLGQGATQTVSSPTNWGGRFWARTWCGADGNNHCATGDCGDRIQCNGAGGVPPVTLAEITLKGHEGLDFYDISLVDGFNVKASMQPIGGSGACRRVGCDNDLNNNCPNELRVIYRGHTVACNSSCNKYNTDQYCCRNHFGQPATCNPNSWPVNSARYFKQGCPDAYSYAYDDSTSTFTCKSNKYRITFG